MEQDRRLLHARPYMIHVIAVMLVMYVIRKGAVRRTIIDECVSISTNLYMHARVLPRASLARPCPVTASMRREPALALCGASRPFSEAPSVV